MMDRIEINDLVVDAVIGLLDWEQETTQKLRISIALELPLGKAGDTGELESTVDYAAVTNQLRFLAVRGRFHLLESLAQAICRLLLTSPTAAEGRASIDAVELRLEKLEIFDGNPVPAVFVRRTPTAPQHVHISDGVTATQLVHARERAAWRVVIDAGAAFDAPDRWSLCDLQGDDISGRIVGPLVVVAVSSGPRARDPLR